MQQLPTNQQIDQIVRNSLFGNQHHSGGGTLKQCSLCS